MIVSEPDDMGGFSSQPPSGGGWRALFVSDQRREPVVLMHELPAITPEVMHLARVFVASGFKVYLPSLMERPGQTPTWGDQLGGIVGACVRREILAALPCDFTRSGAAGVRALARQASAACGGGGVGLVGLCLTGGFAIAGATEPQVAGAVA